MTHPVKGIDHVYMLIADLDAGAAAMERMGFVVTPRGTHSAAKGTGNHTIMFEAGDYFELLGILAETELNAPQRDLLTRGGGLHAIACKIGDARAAAAELAGLRLATTPVSDFSRPVDLPGGGTGEASFSTVAFAPEERPHGWVFMCQHHTRDTVWVPAWMAHPNGATGLAGITIAHPSPRTVAQGFARLFAAGRVVALGDGWRTETGDTPIDCVTPEALAARYPDIDTGPIPADGYAVMQVRVRDLRATAGVLVDAGLTLHDTASGVAVAPAEACGAIVEFVA